MQTRGAKCVLRNGRQISDFACNRLEKLTSRACNTHACTSYQVGEWSKVSYIPVIPKWTLTNLLNLFIEPVIMII